MNSKQFSIKILIVDSYGICNWLYLVKPYVTQWKTVGYVCLFHQLMYMWYWSRSKIRWEQVGNIHQMSTWMMLELDRVNGWNFLISVFYEKKNQYCIRSLLEFKLDTNIPIIDKCKEKLLKQLIWSEIRVWKCD